MPNQSYDVLAVGSDRENHQIYSNTGREVKGNPNQPYKLSQIQCHRNGKAFFTCVGDEEVPGAIQIWRMPEQAPMEKYNEVQAHSKPIERLRLTIDNSHLFSVGQDGLVCIFDVKDRDIRMRQSDMMFPLEFSQEILTEKIEMESMQNEEQTTKQELASQKNSNEQDVNNKLNVKRQVDDLHRLEGDKESNLQQAKNKEESLNDNIREAKNNNDIKRKELLDAQQEIIEAKRTEYNQRMLEDASRYQ